MTETARVQALKRQLVALTDPERQQVLMFLRALSGLRSTESATEPATEIGVLYVAISAELKRQLHTSSPHYPTFRKQHPQSKEFVAAAEIVVAWTKEWFDRPITQLELQTFYLLVARLIVQAVRQQQMPEVPLWRLICFQLKNVPALVDRAFPGYLASGMLGKVLQLRKQGGTHAKI